VDVENLKNYMDTLETQIDTNSLSNPNDETIKEIEKLEKQIEA
jgi:uncharacterized coiled-coil DUF342 family protein